MEPVDLKITLGDRATADAIEQKLSRSLNTLLPQALNDSFVLCTRDTQDNLLAGLTASTSYGWLLIKTLWVDDTLRRQHLGSALLKDAENRGRVMGCHATWLDTSSPQAMEFYKRSGYTTFGCLRNTDGQFPETHQRWFMQKPL